MKILCLFFAMWLLFGTVGCSRESYDSWPDGDGKTVSIELHFSTPYIGGRASAGSDDLFSEEGKVTEFLYGIFKGTEMVAYDSFTSTTPLHTGDIYRIQNISAEWFEKGDATVMVVANPTDMIRKYFKANQTIDKWQGCVFESDLNEEITHEQTRLFETPMMAGYVKQKNILDSAIVVQVEHIYSRIWYSFDWQGIHSTDKIVIDSIRTSKLMNRTKVFNTSDEADGYHLGNSLNMWGTTVIKNGSNEKPFIGNLTPVVGETYQPEGISGMEILYDMRKDCNIVCRYPWKDGGVNPTSSPIRYYVYCYQWNGTTMEDDPMLEVFYHFVSTDGSVIRKRAFARLYDPNYLPGKRHHGMMRNYTYHVICKIDATSNKLDLQITAHPWREVLVDDIPTFE